jgi:hypothetical protein
MSGLASNTSLSALITNFCEDTYKNVINEFDDYVICSSRVGKEKDGERAYYDTP